MLAFAIEMLGALLSVLGAAAWRKHTRGPKRLVAILPVAIYITGQAISIAATGRDDFIAIYKWALGVMALGAAIGLALMLRVPTRLDDHLD